MDQRLVFSGMRFHLGVPTPAAIDPFVQGTHSSLTPVQASGLGNTIDVEDSVIPLPWPPLPCVLASLLGPTGLYSWERAEYILA